MSMNQIIPANLIETPSNSLTLICKCGDKQFDHRMGAKGNYGACRMCLTCKKFKLPKPIKSKIK